MLGQEHVVRALTHALGSGRLHHAYLFTGTRGVGKTTLARILAKCLNCAEGVSATPCDACGPCRDIDAGRFGDLIEVDAATNTRVEEMRELLDNSQYRPVTGRFKVYIIDEVHMLSRHAFNAMLKTLEEPPEHMKFILATTDPQKVPVTVLSRCLQFALKPMSVDQLVSRLDHILAAERIDFEPAALRLVARGARGSVRDSLSLLDQAIAFGAGRVDEAQVAELLGVAAPEAVLQLAHALADGSGSALLAVLRELVAAGHAADVVLQDFARLMQEVALAQLVGPAAAEAGPPTDAGDGQGPAVAALAARMPPADVQLCYQIALSGRRDLVHAPDEAAGLTMSFLRMLTFLSGRDAPAPSVATDGGARRTPAAGGRMAPAAPVTRSGTAAGALLQPAAAVAESDRDRSGPPAGHPAAGDTVDDVAPLLALPDHPAEWRVVVDHLPPAGVALELARHCVWLGREGQRLHLALAQAHKALLTTQDRLQTLLAPLLGRVQLVITLQALESAAARAGSVASRDDERRAQRLREAEQSIEDDPIVQDLIRDQGARLIPGSVRPRDEAA